LDKLLGKTFWLARARRRIAGAPKLGHYELLHPLGAGGMAEVFKARTLGPAGFERDVVIKRILPAYGRDEDFVRMFVDEARILGLIHHPNVVQAFEFGEDDGTLFLALEYVNGPSLSRILRALRAANRRMPPAIAAYIAREICRALDCVHRLQDEKGAPLEVVHRDVTPSNIIVTPWGGVKLLDFGVAKFTSAARSTREGTVKGKPAYLAPEQLQGKPIDGRVDLFALGIVMHEMLSLQHLFTGDSDLQTAKKIMEMRIPRLGAHRADVPGELERIVLRALERERHRRFDTAAEMARPRRLRSGIEAAPRRRGGVHPPDRSDIAVGSPNAPGRGHLPARPEGEGKDGAGSRRPARGTDGQGQRAAPEDAEISAARATSGRRGRTGARGAGARDRLRVEDQHHRGATAGGRGGERPLVS
jgi:serine/threonine protein kinase